jgi:flagellar protein FlbD
VIRLTRLNKTSFYLNAELVEQVEKTPDTVITLTTGNNIVVRESVEEVVDEIIGYRQKANERPRKINSLISSKAKE